MKVLTENVNLGAVTNNLVSAYLGSNTYHWPFLHYFFFTFLHVNFHALVEWIHQGFHYVSEVIL